MILVKVTYQNINILRSITLCMSFDYTLDNRARVELSVHSRHGDFGRCCRRSFGTTREVSRLGAKNHGPTLP